MSSSSPKVSLKQTFQTSLWTFKLGFSIAPYLNTFYLISKILQFIFPLLTAFFTAKVINEIVVLLGSQTTEITTNLIRYVILSLTFDALNSINRSFDEYLRLRMDTAFDRVMYARYLDKLATIDIPVHENPEFSTKMKTIEKALAYDGFALIEAIAGFIASIIGLLVVIGIFFKINFIFVLAISIPLILNLIVEKVFGLKGYVIWYTQGDERKNASKALDSLKDLEVIKESKVYGFASYISNTYKNAIDKFTASIIKSMNGMYLSLSGIAIVRTFIFGLIQIWLIQQTLLKNLSLTGYSFYLQTIYNVNDYLSRLQISTTRILISSTYVTDLKDFMELKDVIEKPINGIKLEAKAPLIEFKNVSFKYPSSDKYTLKNLSFTIESGERIALIGENGAGKSTIIKLLARFYDVTEGEILINGINIKKLDLATYYKLWGILFQSFAKYWFTLRENIGLGNIEDIDDSVLIEEAGLKTGVDKIASKLKKGYENMLSTDFKDGTNLSGGEWQKVGIARGLFADPKLIILDEPTSALDALSEAQVFEELEKITRDTTMIIVSHRFATVRNANKILVLDSGAVVEQGNHNELMEKTGLYHKMFTTQAEGYK